MATPIAMPKLGMTMSEGTVISWPVPIGERVEKGQTVLVIESEKAEIEIEAIASGVFRHIYVEPDQTVPCGTLLGALTETADEPFDADAFHKENDHPEATAPTLAAEPAPRVTRKPAATAGRAVGNAPIAPAARGLAKKLGIDPTQVPGTGPGGRVTREDVQAFADRRATLVSVAEGVALEVPTEGEGDSVLLLPGLGTDVSSFARQTPALAEHYRVLGVNPRGVGHSDAPEADAYDVATAAADAAALIDAPAHVVGASLGAATALELAVAHPEKVRSLTLITPFTLVDGRLLAVAEAWGRIAATADPETLASALLPWLFSPALLGDEKARKRMHRGLAATVSRVPAATIQRAAEGMRRWSGSREKDLGGIDRPTLVITGGGDLLTPDGAAVARAIRGAALEEIPEMGHGVALEAADAVNERMLAHLASVG